MQMFNRFCFGALLLAGLAVPLTSCSNTTGLTSIVISPSGSSAVTVTLVPPGVAQGHAQFTAIGYYGHAGHQETRDITSQVTWTSSLTQVAVICSNGSPSPCTPATDGLATATGFTANGAWTGFSQITASAPGFNGDIVSNSATFTVTACTSCAGGGTDVTSVAVIPNTQTVTSLGVPVQYEALGTTSSGASVALTNLSGVQWNSSNPSVASIGATTGLATTLGSGTTTITAIFLNADGTAAEGNATLTVQAVVGSAEPLTSMTVAPNAQTALAVGQTSQFLAIATTGTGTSVNLTDQGATIDNYQIKAALWSSSDSSVVSIDQNTGIAKSVGPGAAVITAIATNPDGSVVTGTSQYTVSLSTSSSAEPLTALTVAPASEMVQVGNTVANFLAIGTTGSSTTVNLTDPATYSVPTGTIQWAQWLSSNPAVATIDPNTGVINAKSAGVTAITAIATNPDKTIVTGSALLTVNSVAAEPLVSLAILPATQTSLATGPTANVNFIAIGTTASGATVNMNQAYTVPGSSPTVTIPAATWSSSNPAVAKFLTPATPNVATPLAAGTTAITAMVINPDNSVVTASAAYTVTAPSATEPYVSLAIVPATQTLTATGQTAQFIAIGTTSTGATADLSGKAIWGSSNPAVAQATAVGNGQFAAGTTDGVTAITATVPNASVGGAAGDTTSVTASAALTVDLSATPEPLLSMSILPDSQSAAVGQPVQLLAIGTFSSSAPASIGPGQQNMASAKVSAIYTVNWYSSNPSVATICSQGLPAPACTGVPDGLVTGVSAGTTAITAIASGNTDHSQVTATATFTVSGLSASTISALSIFPASQTITMPEVGQPNPTVNLVVIGTNGAGLQSNVTSQISWTSSNPAVVPTTNCSVPGSTPATGCNIISGPNSAVVTAIGPGTTTITASFTNPSVGGVASSVVTQIATLTVTGPAAEPLLSMAILPNAPSVQYPTQTTQLTAIGTFSQAPVTQNLTNTVTWSSSNPSIATVCNAVATTSPAVPVSCATTPGLVTGIAQGTVAITATTTNTDGSFVYATVPFTVQAGSALQMSALTIVPDSLTLSATGQPGSLIALGTSTVSGLQQDVTDSPQLAWSSSNQAIATVSTLGAQTQTCTLNNATPPVQVCTSDLPGVVKGVSVGSTNIAVEWTNPASGSNPATVVTATANITVTSTPAAEPLLAISISPAAVSISDLDGTAQFLAFGTFSTAPTTMDITNGFFHAGFSSPQYPSSACTDAYATADAAVYAADVAATPPLAVDNLPNPQCQFTQVTWVSLPDPFDFPINSAGAAGGKGGLITAYNAGTDEDVYAVAANPDGTLVYGSTGPSGGNDATFSCPYIAPTYAILSDIDGVIIYDYNTVVNPGSCNSLTVSTSLFSTLTVFNASETSTGLNQSNWLITAPDTTNTTQNIIHCGPGSLTGGSVCEATYPTGTTVTVTAPAQAGVTFDGWSQNCTPTAPISAAGPNSCTVVVGGTCTYNIITATNECPASNVSVGAIFN